MLAVAKRKTNDFLIGCSIQTFGDGDAPLDIDLALVDVGVSVPDTPCATVGDFCQRSARLGELLASGASEEDRRSPTCGQLQRSAPQRMIGESCALDGGSLRAEREEERRAAADDRRRR